MPGKPTFFLQRCGTATAIALFLAPTGVALVLGAPPAQAAPTKLLHECLHADDPDERAEACTSVLGETRDPATVVRALNGRGNALCATRERCAEAADSVRTLEYLLEEYRVIKDVNAETVAQSEVLAELAAIELTYPYTERCSDIEKLGDPSDPLTTKEISEYYKIPEDIVERACKQWFHEMATTIWSLVDQAVEEE